MRKLTSHPFTQHINTGAETISSTVVGQSLRHESAAKQVAGTAPFIDDYPTPAGCLHAALILSPASNETVKAFDFSAVKSAPGVKRIITIRDIPGIVDIGTLHGGEPLLHDIYDETLPTRYFAQPLAIVIADSYKNAWFAASQANITMGGKATPVVLSKEQAYDKPHLLPVHQMGLPQNMANYARVINGSLEVGGQEHFYLETQISLAEQTEDGGIFVRCSTQNPTEVQNLVAEVLHIPFNLVTVDMRRMGGGFGGKESQAANFACMASLGVHLTGKAVKIRLPRSIDMAVTGKRHPFSNNYQLAVNSDGIIQASNIEVNGLCGHSADLSDAIVDRAMFHVDNAYSLGSACVIGNRLKTDMVSHTAFRGFGGPQGMVVIEKAMEHVAIELGIDPFDLRLRNLYTPQNNVTPYGMTVDQTQELEDVMNKLAQSSDYRSRRQSIHDFNATSPILKRGISLTPMKFGISFTATHLNQAGALIHVYTDGTVQVSHGGTEMGQGLHTKVQQIVAQTFGIPCEWVLVTSTRTDKVPNTSPTAASSGADLNGMAAHNAAKIIKQRLLEFAKTHYELNDTVDIQDGALTSNEQPIEWSQLIQQAYLNRVSLSSTGYYSTPKIGYDRESASGRPFFYFAIGACCSEVMIDTLTGEMTVERVDILHDVGNSLNPAIDLGQIEGGYIQGLGWLTTEELVWQDDGKLLTNSPMNYKIPSIADYPKTFNVELYDVPNPEHSIYRSKAVGEPPFMHAISTWCAIYDAVASISEHSVAPNLDAPATGERILNACQAQRDAVMSHQ